ncbi:hypothetical protein [Pseudoalteromonas luteoviolacea]|uniref:Uncharacterized protein n=1 Tax=Pseudoalteromonas luteoviolacea S4060-1 TaxID=1365257 RepID=A0A161YVS2_9GAMM|nr:hypothetical protein [Pseudoalteromonas luteoviolacea]KZN66832.1 hypothetical protein N478_18535 [Pseudoalteromonas luteoviolacea S4060-1]
MAGITQRMAELTSSNTKLSLDVSSLTSEVSSVLNSMHSELKALPSRINGMMDAHHYVSHQGDDVTADGTSAKPFKSIKRAIESTPENCVCTIQLIPDGKSTPFVIDELIDLGRRAVEIRFVGNEIHLDDKITTVFNCAPHGSLQFSNWGGASGSISMSSNKTLMYAKAGANLHIGGYESTFLDITGNAHLTLMQGSYTSARGISSISLSRFRLKNAEAPAGKKVTAFASRYAGSCFVNNWQSTFPEGVFTYSESSNQIHTVFNSLHVVTT